MNPIRSLNSVPSYPMNSSAPSFPLPNTANGLPLSEASSGQSQDELRNKFGEWVGTTFLREMMKSMRKSTGDAAYMNGGQAEKMFQQQLDELLIERMAKADGNSISEQLYQQFLRTQPPSAK